MNLAIMNADGISTESIEREVPHATYRVKKPKQWTVLYHQLVYLLIFWNDKVDCGTVENEPIKNARRAFAKY
jgi:hypothetical protein